MMTQTERFIGHASARAAAKWTNVRATYVTVCVYVCVCGVHITHCLATPRTLHFKPGQYSNVGLTTGPLIKPLKHNASSLSLPLTTLSPYCFVLLLLQVVARLKLWLCLAACAEPYELWKFRLRQPRVLAINGWLYGSQSTTQIESEKLSKSSSCSACGGPCGMWPHLWQAAAAESKQIWHEIIKSASFH